MGVSHMMIVGLVLLVLGSGIVYVFMFSIPMNMNTKYLCTHSSIPIYLMQCFLIYFFFIDNIGGTTTASTIKGGSLTGMECIVKTPMACDEIKRCIDTCNSMSRGRGKPEISCSDGECKCTFC
jgi:hypothetical protein